VRNKHNALRDQEKGFSPHTVRHPRHRPARHNDGNVAADPKGKWYAENGTWQDGGTIIPKNDGSYVAFLSKFSTQASETDNGGHLV
jgi:uncharacterized protein YukJ